MMFKIKAGYYLKLLTPETMNLVENAKSKIKKDKNRENVSHLDHCNIVNNDYQQDSRTFYTFTRNESFSQKFLICNFNKLKYGLLIKVLNL